MNTRTDTSYSYDFLATNRATNVETTFKELDQQIKNVNPAAFMEVKKAGTRRMIQDADPPATQK